MSMSNKTIGLDERLHHYLLSHSVRETSVMRRLREQTMEHEWARMQIAPEQGQLMALLVEIIGARQAIEIGTFTGYSALWIASALPPDGRLICCDISEEWTREGIPFWEEAGVRERIDLRIAPALKTLEDLLKKGAAGRFDFAFVDADKPNYLDYYEYCHELLRPGGLILFDNTLWGGAVADPDDEDEDTRGIRALNEHLHRDGRVSLSLIPIGDGLTVARKR
jgi:predicted O-methyltransferase YrrM